MLMKYIMKKINVCNVASKLLTASYRSIKVLGIETSCDDTGVAIVDTNRQIYTESLRNQWQIHKSVGAASYKNPHLAGGIIPNLARNLHYDNLLYTVNECIESMEDKWDSVDAIALTIKPGLELCLWQGINFTKQLLDKYKKPLIPIHHMEAHALTPRLFEKNLVFPYLTLLVSGGHTLIGLVADAETFIRFGESTDIAIGNCIDRVARKLGLYQENLKNSLSGGELIEQYAKHGDINKYQDLCERIKYFCNNNRNCDFSFSGLLSLTHDLIKKETETIGLNETVVNDICASFQHVLALLLRNRLERAIVYYRKEMNYKNDLNNIVVSGGVASNRYIYQVLKDMCSKYDINLITPPVKYCTDNGVMIAWNGCEKVLCNSKSIINVVQQTPEYFEALRPSSHCELGYSIEKLIKNENIKIKF